MIERKPARRRPHAAARARRVVAGGSAALTAVLVGVMAIAAHVSPRHTAAAKANTTNSSNTQATSPSTSAGSSGP